MRSRTLVSSIAASSRPSAADDNMARRSTDRTRVRSFSGSSVRQPASAYRVLYHPMVLSRDLPRLDPPTRLRIRTAIERKPTTRPEAAAKPLAHTTQRLCSLRVGDWRVVFALRDDEIWVLRIGHCREA